MNALPKRKFFPFTNTANRGSRYHKKPFLLNLKKQHASPKITCKTTSFVFCLLVVPSHLKYENRIAIENPSIIFSEYPIQEGIFNALSESPDFIVVSSVVICSTFGTCVKKQPNTIATTNTSITSIFFKFSLSKENSASCPCSSCSFLEPAENRKKN